jgi:2-keto-4-pentenoate hydratase/2-oxohepta-3-ene-1,7-dioic acid hydratase in catechol pathway
MKLLRVGPAGAEKPALLDPEMNLRDLSKVIRDFDAVSLSPQGLQELARIEWKKLPKIPGTPRIGPCVPRPLNFVGIGANYKDHVAEAGLPIPTEPLVFLKAVGSHCGPYDEIRLPPGSVKTDWEAELAVVIGTKAQYVTEDAAMDHVAGYFVCNDVSERAFQNEHGGTMIKGKGCDTFGPVGPWLVTKDEVADPQDLDVWLDVDGVRRQNGNTEQMIFGVRKLISYVSHFFTLFPGDIISTGTPGGVGMGIKPKATYLEAGQTVRLGVEGLGEQSHVVVQA